MHPVATNSDKVHPKTVGRVAHEDTLTSQLL